MKKKKSNKGMPNLKVLRKYEDGKLLQIVPTPYWPKPGETVRILTSPHNVGAGKVGIVSHPLEGGFVIIVQLRDPSSLEDGKTVEGVIWAETVEPYTENKQNEPKR